MRILLILVFLLAQLAALAISPLTVAPGVRYFLDTSGNPVYMTGSHHWKDLQDYSRLTPLDYNAYLDLCVQKNWNSIRMWFMDKPSVNYVGSTPWGDLTPMPWTRTGPGKAGDGGLKWNLAELNPDYFDRLSNRVSAANARGIYVSVMLWDGVSIRNTPGQWSTNCYNPPNNVNGTSLTTGTVYTLTDAAWLGCMTNYVRRVVDTVNGFDGVMFEIGNEMPSFSKDFQYYMVRLIKEYEATKPKQHRVGMTAFDYATYTTEGLPGNTWLTDSPADWISLFGAEVVNVPPIAPTTKVNLYDSDHVQGQQGTVPWVWKSFTRGHGGVWNMDSWDFPDQPAVDQGVRTALGVTKQMASRVNLNGIVPSTSVCGSGYALTNSSREYVLFYPDGNPYTVVLPGGYYYTEHWNPATGAVLSTSSFRQLSNGSRQVGGYLGVSDVQLIVPTAPFSTSNPLGADSAVSTYENTDYTFAIADFPFTDADGHAFSGIEIATIETAGELKAGGVDILPGQSVPQVGQLVFRPAPNAFGLGYATFMFRVRDSSGALSEYAYKMTINVVTGRPVVVTQPSNLTAGIGTVAPFAVVASGQDPLTYQWRFNGVAISGATSSSYAVANVSSQSAGSYDVLVSNALGSTTSAAAILTVIQQGLLANGSFESDYAAWTRSGNQSIQSGAPYQATSGTKLVAFNAVQSTPNAVLSQTIATVSGRSYVVAFDLGAFSLLNHDEQRAQLVILGNATLASQLFSVFAPATGNAYSAKTLAFTADGPTATITFRDQSLTTKDTDLLLDNVRVTSSGPATATLTVNSSNPTAGVPITVSPADSGGLSTGPTPLSRTYAGGASVSLTAPATAAGNNFTGWQLDGTSAGSSATLTVNMDGNHTVTAVYVTPIPNYGLTVNSSNPTAGVSITVSPADNGGLSTGPTPLSRAYASGATVSLTAPATAAGNNFTGWQLDGASAGSSATLTVSMDGNHTVTAVYVTPIPNYALTVNSANPATGVSITVSPADNGGFTSGPTPLSRTYASGATVSLTAPAAAVGNNFTGWQLDGASAGSSATLTVSMDGNHTVTAMYVTPTPNYVLTVNSSNPTAGVSITVSPANNGGLGTGPTPLSRTYASGATVSLTAPATAAGNNFTGWQLDEASAGSSATLTVSMDGNHTVTAMYVTPTPNYALTVNSSNPTAGVSITVSPADNGGLTTGPTPLSRTYASGSTVSLTAPAAAAGNNFTGWQLDGASAGSSATLFVNMDGDHTVTAVYVTPTPNYALTVNSSTPDAGVTIVVSPADGGGLSTGPTPFSRSYLNGTSVTLIAPLVAAGNNFTGWQLDGASAGANTTLTINMTSDHSFTAVYAPPSPVTYSLTVNSANPTSGVSVTVSPADSGGLSSGATPVSRVYASGTTVSLTVPATAVGNNFSGWQVDGANGGANTTLTVNMNGNHTVAALFVAPPVVYTVALSSSLGAGVLITNSPADNTGVISGVTDFNLAFNAGTSVGFKAAATASGNNFAGWQKDGANAGTTPTLTFTVSANTSVKALYAPPPIVYYPLTIDSTNPASNVSITLSPVDHAGAGNGATPFKRSYASGTVVSLTAPLTAAGNNFSAWQKDGVNMGANAVIQVTMNASHSVKAVYTPPVFYTLSISSVTPNSGVTVTVSPADKSGAGNGSTSFTRSYLSGTTVTLTAPSTSGANIFSRWQKDGTDLGSSTVLSLSMDANHAVKAFYRKK